MSKILQHGKKLKALALGGDGGEKQNAEMMLAKLCERYHLKMEDFDEADVVVNEIVCDKQHEWLLAQVAQSVSETAEVKVKNTDVDLMASSGIINYQVICTVPEFKEIETKYNFYLEILKEEMEVFQVAFIIANSLYPLAENPDHIPTEKEIQLIERAQTLAKRMNGRLFFKQLGN